ncbi:hypothetical protein V8J88_04195 [Massilia sp. W12]|uniref:hypothetical protein n=1 Tax=Massilia sp. W12 TaxID=3126507 RepID=UPI0030D39960
MPIPPSLPLPLLAALCLPLVLLGASRLPRLRRRWRAQRTLRAMLQAQQGASWPLQVCSLSHLCSPAWLQPFLPLHAPAWLLREAQQWRLLMLTPRGDLYQGCVALDGLQWLEADAGQQSLRRQAWIAFDDGRQLFYLSAADDTRRLWHALQALPPPRRMRACPPAPVGAQAQRWAALGGMLFLFALGCAWLNPYSMRGQIDYRWLDQACNLGGILLLWRSWRLMGGTGLHWRSRLLPCLVCALGLTLALRNGIALLDVAISAPGSAQAWRLQQGALSTPAAPGLSWRLPPARRSPHLPAQAVLGLTTLHGRLGTLQTDYRDELQQKLRQLQSPAEL